jgi:hypothetical protein
MSERNNIYFKEIHSFLKPQSMQCRLIVENPYSLRCSYLGLFLVAAFFMFIAIMRKNWYND